MSDRTQVLTQFLTDTGWQDADRKPIAGDASARSYQRLIHPKTRDTAILMDAPPDRVGSSVPFVSVASYLSRAGLSAPRILAQDMRNGFLLLEDLGDALFSRVIADDPALETTLYEAAVDVIVQVHNRPNPRLPRYGPAQMAQATDLAFLHYRSTPTERLTPAAQYAIQRLADHLAELGDFNAVSLRDFHADNLIWMPDREGVARVGLLDFQDAVLTHPCYDLVSLIRDARRDVSADLADRLITRFCDLKSCEEGAFRAAAALISAQRNLRILGIFARLSRQMGKPHYIDLIPRVWAHLQTDLSHPALAPLSKALAPLLDPPSPTFMDTLRTPCQTP